jgi:hypothetical protein
VCQTVVRGSNKENLWIESLLMLLLLLLLLLNVVVAAAAAASEDTRKNDHFTRKKISGEMSNFLNHCITYGLFNPYPTNVEKMVNS